MKYLSQITILVAGLCFGCSSVATAKPSVAVDDKGVAVGGYDVVAYHTQAEAVPGKSRFSHQYGGATYMFSSSENRESFKAKPSKFLPEFGGYCAFGMGMQAKKVPTNPKTFKIYNGKLLLFYNGPYQGKNFNTKVPWNGNEAELLAKAQANWRKVAKK